MHSGRSGCRSDLHSNMMSIEARRSKAWRAMYITERGRDCDGVEMICYAFGETIRLKEAVKCM